MECVSIEREDIWSIVSLHRSGSVTSREYTMNYREESIVNPSLMDLNSSQWCHRWKCVIQGQSDRESRRLTWRVITCKSLVVFGDIFSPLPSSAFTIEASLSPFSVCLWLESGTTASSLPSTLLLMLPPPSPASSSLLFSSPLFNSLLFSSILFSKDEERREAPSQLLSCSRVFLFEGFSSRVFFPRKIIMKASVTSSSSLPSSSPLPFSYINSLKWCPVFKIWPLTFKLLTLLHLLSLLH